MDSFNEESFATAHSQAHVSQSQSLSTQVQTRATEAQIQQRVALALEAVRKVREALEENKTGTDAHSGPEPNSVEATIEPCVDQALEAIFKAEQTLESWMEILKLALAFSRMLHGAQASSGGTTDVFYRSFVPEVGSMLYGHHVELVKRCLRTERGEQDRVGATVFLGLVKVGKQPPGGDRQQEESAETVVRRAQVICECALHGTGAYSLDDAGIL